MTEKELRDLDAEVHRAVFVKFIQCVLSGPGGWVEHPSGDAIPHYSTDLRAAWEVVERLTGSAGTDWQYHDFFLRKVPHEWRAFFRGGRAATLRVAARPPRSPSAVPPSPRWQVPTGVETMRKWQPDGRSN